MSERDVCEMGQLEKYYANNGKRIKHIVNQILRIKTISILWQMKPL